jgi:hypothetical protein
MELIYIVVNRATQHVFANETIEPPAGAYRDDAYEVKPYKGRPPTLEQRDDDGNVIIEADLDPTLDLSVEELRSLEYEARGLTPELSMELLLDDIVADLNGLLSQETKDKIKALNDERQKIKDKYPKLVAPK